MHKILKQQKILSSLFTFLFKLLYTKISQKFSVSKREKAFWNNFSGLTHPSYMYSRVYVCSMYVCPRNGDNMLILNRRHYHHEQPLQSIVFRLPTATTALLPHFHFAHIHMYCTYLPMAMMNIYQSDCFSNRTATPASA